MVEFELFTVANLRRFTLHPRVFIVDIQVADVVSFEHPLFLLSLGYAVRIHITRVVQLLAHRHQRRNRNHFPGHTSIRLVGRQNCLREMRRDL